MQGWDSPRRIESVTHLRNPLTIVSGQRTMPAKSAMQAAHIRSASRRDRRPLGGRLSPLRVV